MSSYIRRTTTTRQRQQHFVRNGCCCLLPRSNVAQNQRLQNAIMSAAAAHASTKRTSRNRNRREDHEHSLKVNRQLAGSFTERGNNRSGTSANMERNHRQKEVQTLQRKHFYLLCSSVGGSFELTLEIFRSHRTCNHGRGTARLLLLLLLLRQWSIGSRVHRVHGRESWARSIPCWRPVHDHMWRWCHHVHVGGHTIRHTHDGWSLHVRWVHVRCSKRWWVATRYRMRR